MKQAWFGVGVIILACSVIVLFLTNQANNVIKFPKDLVFAGQILDPICVDIIGEHEETPIRIDPLDCRSPDYIYEEQLPRRPDLAQHMVHVSYRPVDFSMGGAGPFVAYKFIGTIAGGHILSVRSSGGGSGVFSALRLVRRVDDRLEVVHDFGGGDRCNGGIFDAAVTAGGQLVHKVFATPFDLVALSIEGEPPFKAYDDLPACAACCAGMVEYRDESVVAIELDPQFATYEANPNQPVYACYNTLVAERVSAGKVRLGIEEAQAFSADFLKKCMPQSGVISE
jgi:hypothetical protein